MYMHNITLSFDDLNTVSTDIKIKQNDVRSHKLIVSGNDFADASRAVIKFLRPDGVVVCDELAYNNQWEYVVCASALSESGTVKSEVSFYDENARITSCAFTFEVIAEINADCAIVETDNLPLLQSFIDTLENCVQAENGKGLSSNDFSAAHRNAVENLGYYVDSATNIQIYSSNSIFEISKLESKDITTGGLQADTYIMLNSPGGWRDIVCGSVSLQEELDGKADKSSFENLDDVVRSIRPILTETSDLKLTPEANKIYAVSGSVTEITLPSGEYGDFIQVDFYSGKTPTGLTITSSSGITDHDLIPEANTAYSLYFDWGLINAADYGWRFSYAAYPYNTEV